MVRNLCYMVTRREKMKLTLCDLQEKIFQLQIQLLEEETAAEKIQKAEKRKNGVKNKRKERRKHGTGKKKERWKSESGSLLRELGLFQSFPLESSLFDSWLAKSVQITADDMLSQWALGAQHHDRSSSLLSDQLMQGEESLLNLMMENSMQSAWKTPQLGRKPRGSSKPRSRRPSGAGAQRVFGSVASGGPSAAKGFWEKSGHAGRRGEKSRSSSKAGRHHQTRSCDPNDDPPPQPPISKMDSCHISEERGRWDSVHMATGFTASASPLPASGPGAAAPDAGVVLRGSRPRPTRQGKARSRVEELDSTDLPFTGKGASLLDAAAAETDGYFSDGESDLETRSGGRKLRLPQLHPASEDLLRRSVLAS